MIVPFLKQLGATPPLLATLAGILFAVMGWDRCPAAVDKTLDGARREWRAAAWPARGGAARS